MCCVYTCMVLIYNLFHIILGVNMAYLITVVCLVCIRMDLGFPIGTNFYWPVIDELESLTNNRSYGRRWVCPTKKLTCLD